jgi:hypothetical protein
MLQLNSLGSRRAVPSQICSACRASISSAPTAGPVPLSSHEHQRRAYSDKASTKTQSEPAKSADKSEKNSRSSISKPRRSRSRSAIASGSAETQLRVLQRVLQSMQTLEASHNSLRERLNTVQEKNGETLKDGVSKQTGSKKKRKVATQDTADAQLEQLDLVKGTLDVLRNVLEAQKIPLHNLKKAGGRKSSKTPTDGAGLPQPTTELDADEAALPTNSSQAQNEAVPGAKKSFASEIASGLSSNSSPWDSLVNRLTGRATAANVAVVPEPENDEPITESQDDLSSATLASKGSKDWGRKQKGKGRTDGSVQTLAKALNKGSSRMKAHIPVNSVRARSLSLEPVDIPFANPVPQLSYGLDRVLFNPGVYQVQDLRSKVYNFDPYLAKIMPINEFDFSALKEYVTSSKDTTLIALAAEKQKKYTGSTSSMTQMLSHFHYLLSAWRPIDPSQTSRSFSPDFLTFTRILRAPAATFLHWKDGVYAIDADKEFDSANILSMLGKSMEKLLTLPKEEYEKYRKSKSDQLTMEEKNAEEAFHYTEMGDFMMRSQLDAHDERLPGAGMFDLKTRAVISIRMDARGYQKGRGYEIRNRLGQWESFEREYFDMIRSAFLKYSLQVRMGRMDGIFVAFHNTQRIFGFQYISLQEMDRAIHGSSNRNLGQQEFLLSLHLLNEALNRATEKFPGKSLRLHVETRPSDPPFMYIFAKPVTDQQIAEVQSANRAAIEKYEKEMMGTLEEESQGETDGTSSIESVVDEDLEPTSSGEAQLEAIEVESEELGDEQASMETEDPEVLEEGRVQSIQSQAVWEEMNARVSEAVENDELGVNYVREAIQDALTQSGLLRASSTEEAQRYVDALMEALTRGETSEPAVASDKEVGRTEKEAEASSVWTGSAIETVQGELDGPAQNTENDSEDSERSTFDQVDNLSTSSSQDPTDLGTDTATTGATLKELILKVAGQVDEKSGLDDRPSQQEEGAQSNFSKLHDFERLLSELVRRSRDDDSGSSAVKSAAISDSNDTIPVSSSDGESSDPTSQPREEDPALEETLDETIRAQEPGVVQDEIFGMILSIRNKVDGKYVTRPTGNNERFSWTVEYAFEELPTDRANNLYKKLLARRRKELMEKDRETEWHRAFEGKLASMSERGRNFRQREDEYSRGKPVHVFGRDKPLEWAEAFGTDEK